MEITTRPLDLQAALDLVLRKLGPGPDLVHMHTQDDSLVLVVRHRTFHIRVRVDAHVVKPGHCQVPGTTLHEVVKNLPNKTMGLRLQSPTAKIEILSGGVRSKLAPPREAEDLPALPSAEALPIQVAAADLRAVIVAGGYASDSDNETHPVYGAGHLVLGGKSIGLSTTDGHRAAIARSVSIERDLPSQSVLIPSAALAKLVEILDWEDDVALSIDKDLLLVRCGPVELFITPVDGLFPDLKGLVPKPEVGDLNAVMDRKLAAAALSTVAVIARDAKQQVTLTFSPAKGQRPASLRLEAKAPETGSATTEVDLQTPVSEPTKVAVSARYLHQALTSTAGDNVLIALRGKVPIVLVEPHGPKQGTQRALMAPILT
jgi:DNA polymerase-3 subunit beta